MASPSLEIQDWELIDYSQAVERQLQLVDQVATQKSPGVIVFCTHPPIVTLGRKTQEGDVTTWSGPKIEVSRGGRATYHGPSQIVIYPIVNLEYPSDKRGPHDLGWYLKTLGQSIANVLKTYGLEARAEDLGKDQTGVWVGSQKIGSLGIGIKNWISYHGAALNVDDDPTAFSGMRPCGFESSVMTNMEKLLNQKIDREALKELLKKELCGSLAP